MKTSKIMFVHSIKPREWPNWKLFFYDLEMENWDRGNIGKKTDNAFQPWQELNYEIEADPKLEWKFRIKEEKKEFKKSFPQKNYNSEYIITSLKCATDIVLPSWWADKVMEIADKFYNRMKQKSLSPNPSNNG